MRKQSSCSMQLTNGTDKYIAFKVKTVSPKRYCVGPNSGIVLPNSVCNVTVIMQAHKEVPDMPCKDKFCSHGHKKQGYNPRNAANPPSPVPEEYEEGSPRTSSVEDDNRMVSMSLPESALSMISKMTEEKATAIQKNKKLLEELELLERQTGKTRSAIAFMFVVLLLGILLGFVIGRMLNNEQVLVYFTPHCFS